jgi:hypothetical protein
MDLLKKEKLFGPNGDGKKSIRLGRKSANFVVCRTMEIVTDDIRLVEFALHHEIRDPAAETIGSNLGDL